MKVIASDERTAVVSRVMELLDPGSFMEMGEHVSARFTEFYHPDSVKESDGVVTGYGTIDGNLVFVYAQDNEVMGGTFGEQHGRKIVDLYEHAIKANGGVDSYSSVTVPAAFDADNGSELIVKNGVWAKQQKKFIVTLTPTELDYSGTMDKTVAQINEAYEAGQEIVFNVLTSATSHMMIPVANVGYSDAFDYPSFNAYLFDNNTNVMVLAFTATTNDGTKQTYGTFVYSLTPAS